MGEPFTDALSALETGYRVVIGVAGGWTTARLAPDTPMSHALVLGLVGRILECLGFRSTPPPLGPALDRDDPCSW